jgi:hypothetical protein
MLHVITSKTTCQKNAKPSSFGIQVRRGEHKIGAPLALHDQRTSASGQNSQQRLKPRPVSQSAYLVPGHNLQQLFKSSKAARKRDEGI